MLRLTENSNNNGDAFESREITENYHSKEGCKSTVEPLNFFCKNNTNSGDLAHTNGKNNKAETSMVIVIQETRDNETESQNNNVIQSTACAHIPGAYAVAGIGGQRLNQSQFSNKFMIDTSIGIYDGNPTLLTATLVSEETLPEEMHMKTTLPALSAVPMEDPQKSRRRLWNILMAVAVLFAGIGGAVVAAISSQQRKKNVVSNPTTTPSLSPSLTPSQAPTNSPSSQPSNMLEGLFTIVALDLNSGLPAKNTSQDKALNWLLEQKNELEYSAEELRQCFALVTLIFHPKGPLSLMYSLPTCIVLGLELCVKCKNKSMKCLLLVLT